MTTASVAMIDRIPTRSTNLTIVPSTVRQDATLRPEPALIIPRQKLPCAGTLAQPSPKLAVSLTQEVYPRPTSETGRHREAGNEMASRHDLFEQHQDRKSRDPQHRASQ